jgi:hypothetical protein
MDEFIQEMLFMNTLISVDVSQPADQVLDSLYITDEFNILFINRTNSPLVQVGTYNATEHWPIEDVGARTISLQSIRVRKPKVFSFSSNYRLGGGKYFQFVATWPITGSRRIGLGAINEEGTIPARAIWNSTSNARDKAVDNFPYSARASIRTKENSIIWIFEVT